MPHIVIKMYPGRSEDQKQKLTKAIIKEVTEIFECSEKVVSIGIEETEKELWPEAVYRPEILEKKKTLYKKPGYNPFD
ncbi:MAG: tautomerase family protein [Flavobacteriales bacterium]|nr:tautomerase family protein [Flavobacteriales bacterium]